MAGLRPDAEKHDVCLWASLVLVVVTIAGGIGLRWYHNQQALDDSRHPRRNAAETERLRKADAHWRFLEEQQEAQRQSERARRDGSHFDERIRMYQEMHDELLQEYKRHVPTSSESQRILGNLKAHRQRIEALQAERAKWQRQPAEEKQVESH